MRAGRCPDVTHGAAEGKLRGTAGCYEGELLLVRTRVRTLFQIVFCSDIIFFSHPRQASSEGLEADIQEVRRALVRRENTLQEILVRNSTAAQTVCTRIVHYVVLIIFHQ